MEGTQEFWEKETIFIFADNSMCEKFIVLYFSG
jgi:hypothetical protein